jgi:hypothetical protein
MKTTIAKSLLFLLVILSLGLALAPFLRLYVSEGYENKTAVPLLPGTYPLTVDKPILDSFPLTGKTNVLENKDFAYTNYPIFQVGSYAQITNNMKVTKNPDNGTCTPAMFCNLLYKDADITKEHETNVETVGKNAEDGPGARVNYYRSTPNQLFYSIPTSENILY